jgi:hypothetical protein
MTLVINKTVVDPQRWTGETARKVLRALACPARLSLLSNEAIWVDRLKWTKKNDKEDH